MQEDMVAELVYFNPSTKEGGERKTSHEILCPDNFFLNSPLAMLTYVP